MLAEHNVMAAACLIKEADVVLICAGAGMSVYPKQDQRNVYIDPTDFALHYPDMPAKGYRTAYECMGLFGDRSLSQSAKSGFFVRHGNNIRYQFEPNKGYTHLKTILELCDIDDYFVMTSNVDGNFKDAGFSADKLYTPQGEYGTWQCPTPCHRKVYTDTSILDKAVEQVKADGTLPESAIPRCPQCQKPFMMNLRGGGWFIHDHLMDQQKRLTTWVEDKIETKKNIVILEIGAGFNTPIVTRFPMESIMRECGGRGALIRINPDNAQIPSDIQEGIEIKQGWQFLQLVEKVLCHLVSSEEEEKKLVNTAMKKARQELKQVRSQKNAMCTSTESRDQAELLQANNQLGWRQMLQQLSR